jgi:DNA-binding response OmpR family regulator
MESGAPRSDVDELDVLVVEDQPDLASTTAEILHGAGLTAATVSTVDEAVQVLATRDVRCVLLDHHLPGEDGGRFFSEGRDLPPVIVTSGLGPELLAQVQAVRGDQIFACLLKPVAPVELIRAVRAAVRGGAGPAD